MHCLYIYYLTVINLKQSFKIWDGVSGNSIRTNTHMRFIQELSLPYSCCSNKVISFNTLTLFQDDFYFQNIRMTENVKISVDEIIEVYYLFNLKSKRRIQHLIVVLTFALPMIFSGSGFLIRVKYSVWSYKPRCFMKDARCHHFYIHAITP